MINRHNYEEYFLLYADGELNHQQRAAVELFVLQNPDVAEELDTLLQMKLIPDEAIVFPDKASLYRTAEININLNNYEEFFLLYIDRELDAPAREKVEKFVLQHPQLQDEFTLLKQTVLQPEAIVFADKSSLYRKEERKGGYIRFMRVAMAAAVMGLIVLGWWLYPKTNQRELPTVVDAGKLGASQGAKHGDTLTPPVKKADISTTIAINSAGSKNRIVVSPVIKKDSTKKTNQPQVALPNTNNFDVARQPDNKTQQPPVVVRPMPVLPDSATQHLRDVVTAPPADSSQKTVSGLTASTNTSSTSKNVSMPSVDASQMKQTVAYKELDMSDDDHSMYIGALDLNKDKIKGFLKRAGRFFGARPKKDTD